MYFKNLSIVLFTVLLTANYSEASARTSTRFQKPSSTTQQILISSNSMVANALKDYEDKWVDSQIPPISLENNDVDSTVIDYTASLRDSIINIAMDKLGAPYHFGSPGPNSFDCSGFARYVYKQAGISLLRSSREQYKQGEKVEGLDDMSAGDLVFFARRGNIYHVGIVVSVAKDHFKFIHASYSGIIISDSAEPYYRAHYYGAKKIII
jgi:cell wall-associated NlpC family hydrolase